MRESCMSGSERGKPCKGLTYLPYFGGLWEINGSIRNETNPAGYAWEAIALNCAAAGKLTIKIPL